jgi:hypothetical protein
MRPKPVKAIQASRHLGVVHHRHTGKVVARQHTSYPMLVMLMLIVGVFLGGWTRVVTADTYDDPIDHSYAVSASVPGPAPTQVPTIRTPADSQKFKTQPITVSGDCEINTYEVLYRNGVMSGVALCGQDGLYTMQTALFLGSNELQVRAFSLTDVPGPLSDPVTVLYDPTYTSGEVNATTPSRAAPASPQRTVSPSRQTTAPPVTVAGDPLLFKTNYHYRGVYTGQTSKWQISLSGGNAPYAVSIDWGDGTRDLVSRPGPDVLRLEHIYKKTGGYKGSYIVTLTASDASGVQTSLQLLAIVNDPPTASAAITTPSDAGGIATPEYLQGILQYAWPTYGIAMLMLLSFWLGERREYGLLKPRLKKTRHA